MVTAGCSFNSVVLYLDDHLDSDKRRRITEHLDTCEICRDAFYEIFRDRHAESAGHVPHCGENGSAMRV